ncbi:MAG: S1 RNA-binding domain-containing protein [Candidatus Kapaibacteriota bacterium]
MNNESAQKAIKMIEDIIRPLEEGAIYTGTVKEIREGLGAFVEIAPKKQGLLHISQLDYRHVETVGEILKVGDVLDVKLIEMAPGGKIRLSRKALLTPPEGYDASLEHRRGPRPGGGDRDRRGTRRDDRRDDRRGDSRGDNRGPRRRD